MKRKLPGLFMVVTLVNVVVNIPRIIKMEYIVPLV